MAEKPLNILLITSDQQHFSTLGSVNPKIKTPALDRLASEGTRFDRAYCNNPLCSPSRSTIVTGLYPSWHGCWTIGVKLAEDVPTVGEMLSRSGYRTSLVGKAHFQPLACAPGQDSLECQPTMRDLDLWRNFHGPWYGFDHIEIARMHADEAHVGQHYAIWMEEKGLKNWRDYFQKWPPEPRASEPKRYWEAGRRHKWDLPEEFHYTTWTGERTIANIEESVRENKPFFVWSSFHDPHPPYLVPEPWASMYDPEDMKIGTMIPGELDRMPPHHQLTQEESPDFSAWRETPHPNHGFHTHTFETEALKKDVAIYYAMVSFMDQQIGRILKRLDELGVADNTLVVFSTDHGHFFGHHGLIAKGAFHYEDLLRVPFIVRCPGAKSHGQSSEPMQALIDLAPSFLSAANVPIPGSMQGVNQLPVWRGEAKQARDEVIVENRHQPSAVHLRTYITDRYKITLYRDREYGELFDLQNDPEERRNLWDEPSAAQIKCDLMKRFMNAELRREPTRFARIAGA